MIIQQTFIYDEKLVTELTKKLHNVESVIQTRFCDL